MIFVTTGSQLPFDRFVKIIDELAPEVSEEIVVQSIPGKYEPKNIKLVPMMDATQFNERVEQARLIVSHAGMGTILTSMLRHKPVVIFPRHDIPCECNSHHQIDTAERLGEMQYAYVAQSPDELKCLMLNPTLECLHTVGPWAGDELVGYVRDFIMHKI